MGYLERSRAYKGYHYSVIPKDMFEYLHRRTLEMADEVVRILTKNGIRYSICGGTLLGAVTTGRVIPWDDDFDMCVLDEDYERAKQLLLKYGVSDADVQCGETEPRYFHGWMKVRDLKSCVEPDKDGYVHQGVWVDIYCLHRLQACAINWFVCKEHISYLWRRFWRAKLGMFALMKRVLSANLVGKTIKAIVCLLNVRGNGAQQVYVIGSASKVVVPAVDATPFRLYKLEGRDFYGFANADAYLRNHYGENYSILPPDELRRVGINRIHLELDGA